MMTLSHFTGMPFVFDPTRIYRQSVGLNYKPNGLWLSDESEYGWKKWCTDQDYGSPDYETKFNVDTKNVLVLSSGKMIDDFTKEYSKSRQIGGIQDMPSSNFMGSNLIEWGRVIERYDGIIISPYVWECRVKYIWYNPWDCASGCIWNLACLTECK